MIEASEYVEKISQFTGLSIREIEQLKKEERL